MSAFEVPPPPGPVPTPITGLPPMPLPGPVPVDSGLKTTEFWQTTLTQLVAAIVALVGLFRGSSAGQDEQLASSINQMVPIVAALLATFAANRQYVVSRTAVKTSAARANVDIAQAHAQFATAHAAIVQAQAQARTPIMAE